MKKLLFTLAILLVSHLGIAQNAFEADVYKVLQLTGSSAQAEVAKEQILTMVPEAKKAAFIKEFDALVPDYLGHLAKYYMENFTHDEIKQIIKFYETPIGKKLTANAAGLADATTKAAQEWGPKLQSVMMKYMQQ